MAEKTAIVVTSIAAPNKPLRTLAQGCTQRGYEFIVIGDQASPTDFKLDGCDFYSLERQEQLDSRFARLCPTRHYARKNIGYLLAIRNGTDVIIETDDDNIPYEQFWSARTRVRPVQVVKDGGWVNIYRYFSKANIWPRGFPLEHIKDDVPDLARLEQAQADCPIQQHLADGNPDVDAVYRLAMPLPQRFSKETQVALGPGSWCPFNSQNTTWFAQAFALLYLPAYCSFRMTDIWRSFVAQRIAHINGWSILFGGPTMKQERNWHDLLKDFEDEVPGYLHNSRIRDALESLSLKAGEENISENILCCYEKLVSMSLVGPEELKLLAAWLEDLKQSK